MKPIPAVRKRRPSPKGEAVTHVLILAALAVVTALAYSNSFRSGFIVDNRVLMLDPRIRALTAENLRLILSKDYWYGLSGSGLYRPLSSLSYLFNCAILGNGMGPAGYHWLNLLLHILNVSMVYVLGLIVMGKRDRAAALAALWGLHPVLTESVTNIIGRADLLSTCGVLAGLLSYIAIGGSSGGRRTVWLIALLLASAVGVFSKESGTVLPGAMLIYDLTVKFGKFGDRRSIPQFPAAASADTSWRSRAPAYLCAAVPICVFWFVRGRVMAGLPGMHPGFGDNPLVGGGFWNSRLTAVKVLGKYLGLLAWPARLSPDYSYNQVPLLNWPLHTWNDWQAPLALALYLAAAVLAFVSYRRGRTVFFFVAFFFVTMAPTSNLIVQIGTI